MVSMQMFRRRWVAAGGGRSIQPTRPTCCPLPAPREITSVPQTEGGSAPLGPAAAWRREGGKRQAVAVSAGALGVLPR